MAELRKRTGPIFTAAPEGTHKRLAEETMAKERKKRYRGYKNLGTLRDSVNDPQTETQRYAAEVAAKEKGTMDRVQDLGSITDTLNPEVSKRQVGPTALQAGADPGDQPGAQMEQPVPEDMWMRRSRGAGTGMAPRQAAGPRIVREPGQSPVLTNLQGNDMTEAMSGSPSGEIKQFGTGPARGVDALDGAVFTPEGGGPARNQTDAYIENTLADSAHRNELTREAGRASDRAGNGNVSTQGRGAAQGRFAAMARMKGQQRGRADQMKRRKLGIEEDALALEREKMMMGPNVHPDQAAMWKAKAQESGANALAKMSVADQKKWDEKMNKDAGYLELYKIFAKADGEEEQLAASQALEGYKYDKVYKELAPAQPAKKPWLSRNTPAKERTLGMATL